MGLGNSLQTAQAAAGGGGAGVGGWVELGRHTLGSTGDSLGIGSLLDKRYLMILSDLLPSGTIDGRITFNSDTGSNYAYRTSANGGADGTAVSQSDIKLFTTSASSNELFTVGYVSNLSGEEKLYIGNTFKSDGTGGADVPKRYEITAKWANTSNAISDVSIDNAGAGDYASGTEVVVLGWDPADTHTSNFWEELASVTLGSAGDTLDSGTITAKKYLWVQSFTIGTGGATRSSYTMNSDTGSNYTYKYSVNGAGDSSGSSQAKMYFNDNSTGNTLTNTFIINNSANEKLAMSNTVKAITAGAGNAPAREENVGKWVNTSSQITSIKLNNTGTGSFDTNSIIKVWGSD